MTETSSTNESTPINVSYGHAHQCDCNVCTLNRALFSLGAGTDALVNELEEQSMELTFLRSELRVALIQPWWRWRATKDRLRGALKVTRTGAQS